VFNKATGFAFVCPITNKSKGYPFEVTLEGTKQATGVVLADQLKSLDWAARKMKAFDRVSPACIEAVIKHISVIITAKGS
jgi:mRNA interferase MazF